VPLIVGTRCHLRTYRLADAAELTRIAGDLRVARWMTAAFPYPYTLDDARTWLAKATGDIAIDTFAIECAGQLAGGIGLMPLGGEHQGVAEFGYWLGCEYWGRGIATEAARLLAAYAFAQRGLRRIEAHVFATNHASARVLEKSGFVREAVPRRSYVERDGTVSDGWLYARLHDDPPPEFGATLRVQPAPAKR
jgi:ribosomal-protein-alanine N-acetyltransferase